MLSFGVIHIVLHFKPLLFCFYGGVLRVCVPDILIVVTLV